MKSPKINENKNLQSLKFNPLKLLLNQRIKLKNKSKRNLQQNKLSQNLKKFYLLLLFKRNLNVQGKQKKRQKKVLVR